MEQHRIEFGRSLKEWRETQRPRLSQERLAQRMGRSTQTISRWERGEHDVESDDDAAWIREHVGIEPPRPVRSTVTKMSLADRIANLENQFAELRRAVTEALDGRLEGGSVVLPRQGATLPQSELEDALEEAAPPRRDSPKRPRRGPSHE